MMSRYGTRRKIGVGFNSTRIDLDHAGRGTRIKGFGFMRGMCSIRWGSRPKWLRIYPSYVELLRAYNQELVNRPCKTNPPSQKCYNCGRGVCQKEFQSG